MRGLPALGPAFAAGPALSWLTSQPALCRDEGFAGLRLAVDMSWALRPIAGVEQPARFRAAAWRRCSPTRRYVLCQYDRERFDPVTLASVAALHSRSVAAATYYHDAVLRICRQYAPPGIRLAGEIDYRAEEPLSLALAEALRLDGPITVNMAGLSFIDAFCLRMIVTAARSVPAPRQVTLECPAGMAAKLAMFGAADIGCISLVTVDDR